MRELRFDYHLYGTHVRFGVGVASCLAEELADMGLSRPMLLTQSRIAGSARYAELRSRLDGLDILEITGIPPHSSASLVESAAAQAHVFNPDCLIAIGGGSVADTAKALALLMAEGGRLSDHVTGFTPPATVHIPRLIRPKLPIIALPTTASGAETTSSLGTRDDRNRKLMFWNRQVTSRAILIDPDLNEDVPLDLMRQTAMNGIAHCLEGLYSSGRSVVSDALAIQSLDLFHRALAPSCTDEHGQRSLMLAAGHMSGMVLAMARSCLHHAICHVIGARYGLGHGLVNAVILPHALRFNLPAAQDQLAPALAAVNRHAVPAFRDLASWLAALTATHRLPMRLSELGLRDSDLPVIARHTMTERGLAFNPRPVRGAQDVLAILQQAF